MGVPRQQWRRVSIGACEHSDATLRAMQHAGVRLPMPIPAEGYRLMDLVAAVVADSQYWRGLSDNHRFNGRNPAEARAFLKRTVQQARGD